MHCYRYVLILTTSRNFDQTFCDKISSAVSAQKTIHMSLLLVNCCDRIQRDIKIILIQRIDTHTDVHFDRRNAHDDRLTTDK